MKKRIMKMGITPMLILGLAWGCSIDDSTHGQAFTHELTPVTAIEIPDTVAFGKNYDFKISFEKPSNCYTFFGFDYDRSKNVRKISVVSSVIIDEEGCTYYEEPKIEDRDLNFTVKRQDFYVFKFWQGIDSIGEPQYLIKKVVVADSI